jgi:alkaline phosphatase D
MLGREQLAWLKKGLASSDATWKVIVSSVPMSIPTGFPPTNGRDGWANFDQETGFEHELLDILGSMTENGIDNPVWITTDVHFTEAFRYSPFREQPRVRGPRDRHRAAERRHLPEPQRGPDAQPRGPLSTDRRPPADVTDWAQAKRWFNFGTLEVGAGGELTAEVVDTAGEPQFSVVLEPLASCGR